MQQEMAQRRQRAGISRQDSRLSVKSLIESIEKSSSHVRNYYWQDLVFFHQKFSQLHFSHSHMMMLSIATG